jgi:hypothetical protein
MAALFCRGATEGTLMLLGRAARGLGVAWTSSVGERSDPVCEASDWLEAAREMGGRPVATEPVGRWV